MLKRKSDGELRVVTFFDRFGIARNRLEVNFSDKSLDNVDKLIKKGRVTLLVTQADEIEVLKK